MCDNSWNDTNANVVCRQLGYSDTGIILYNVMQLFKNEHCYSDSTGAQSLSSAFYGEGNGTILLDEVQCSGSEARLIDCPSLPIESHNCSHAEDASVICQSGASVQVAEQDPMAMSLQSYIYMVLFTIPIMLHRSGNDTPA